MTVQPTNRDLAFKTFEGRSVMRLSDLRAEGAISVTLRRMPDTSEIVKLGRPRHPHRPCGSCASPTVF